MTSSNGTVRTPGKRLAIEITTLGLVSAGVIVLIGRLTNGEWLWLIASWAAFMTLTVSIRLMAFRR